MRKKIIYPILLSVLLGGGIGTTIGVIYAYIHPMKNLEGYWEENYLLSADSGNYHAFSRINIINRSIQSSVDVYDDRDQVKARCNVLFDIHNANNNIFYVKMLSIYFVDNEDKILSDFLNTPYDVSHPIFYRLDANTILIEQSQGHPVNSTRLLVRANI
ncbi:hypothetical protein BF17_01755 [Yersinia similis]|uniref:Uncharacterized protein n=2 Tax=Yersinia similis TaxID=367190 RepID=A0A0T9PMN5_9GAMM|nr:hypothetical protein BF17_01755 [Yersinia similis]CFQ56536.1 Uncharacterised protein [Yersinia similis]CNB48201.1 Uncharacterised protein [Yersinia similis]CNE85012.1 Uncharacterised protein [Yersinia similis]CNF67985.1 Uncharacterised protein [Yersinia similis]